MPAPARGWYSGARVTLTRQAFLLPPSSSWRCLRRRRDVGDRDRHDLDEAFRNAERLLSLERAYPFR